MTADQNTFVCKFASRLLRECNASEVGAEELQKNRSVHDRAEFASHNRTRGCGEFLKRVLVAS